MLPANPNRSRQADDAAEHQEDGEAAQGALLDPPSDDAHPPQNSHWNSGLPELVHVCVVVFRKAHPLATAARDCTGTFMSDFCMPTDTEVCVFIRLDSHSCGAFSAVPV